MVATDTISLNTIGFTDVIDISEKAYRYKIMTFYVMLLYNYKELFGLE